MSTNIHFRGHSYTAGFDGEGIADWLLGVVGADAEQQRVRDLVGDILAAVPRRELTVDEVNALLDKVEETVYAEA
jgi:hypothetical protein